MTKDDIMKRMKRFVGFGLSIFFVGFCLSCLMGVGRAGAVTLSSAADVVSGSKSDACSGASLGGSDVCGGNTSSGLNTIVKDGVTVLSALVGVAAIIMIIVGGLKYVTSGGDASKTGSAKNTILFALIGLVIVALAQVLVHFVLSNVTQVCPSGQSLKGSPAVCAKN